MSHLSVAVSLPSPCISFSYINSFLILFTSFTLRISLCLALFSFWPWLYPFKSNEAPFPQMFPRLLSLFGFF